MGTFQLWAGWIRWNRFPTLSDRSRQVLTFSLLLLCVTCACVEARVSLYHRVQEVEKAGGDCLRLSSPAYKKTPRGMEGVIEKGREREKEEGRTEGRGEGGEGSKRRRTIRLLMRPFWGAYVGHAMNKQTFTTLNWWFTHTSRHTHRATLCCLCSLSCHLHTGLHISLLYRQRHTHTHKRTQMHTDAHT